MRLVQSNTTNISVITLSKGGRCSFYKCSDYIQNAMTSQWSTSLTAELPRENWLKSNVYV